MKKRKVRLNITAQLIVEVKADSDAMAIAKAEDELGVLGLDSIINNMGNLQDYACKGIIDEDLDLPKTGTEFGVILEETLLRTVPVFAQTYPEAEEVVRNHLDTHFLLSTKEDSIGINVYEDESYYEESY